MDKSRTVYVIKNSWCGFLSKILTFLLSFVVRTIFIRKMGAEYLGVDGLFSNILTMLSLAELGLGNVLTFSLYNPISTNNIDKINQLLSCYKKMYSFIALAIGILGVILVPFLKYIVNSGFSERNIIIFYLLYLLNSVISYIAVCYTTLIKAEQEQYLIDIITTIIKIVTVIVQIQILLFTNNFIAYLLVMVCATLSQNIVASMVAKRRYQIKRVKVDVSRNEKEHIITNLKAVFTYKIGVVVINYTDNILISMLVGTIFVGYYSNYMLIISQITLIISILCNAIIASIGNLSAENDTDKSYIVFRRLLFFFHVFTSVCTIEFIFLLNEVITLWIGEINTLSRGTVLAISFSFYVQNVINPVWMYREAYGLFKQIKNLMLITAALNIIFSIIGGIHFGIAGIIGATGVSRCLTTVWYEPRLLYKYIFKKNTCEYFKLQARYFFSALCALIVSYVIITYEVRFAGFTAVIVKGMSITICSLLSFILFNLRTEEFRYWIGLLKKIVNIKEL